MFVTRSRFFHLKHVIGRSNVTRLRNFRQEQHYQIKQFCTQTENIDLPKDARVVICGGGITGSSIAYHLAESGWTDVVVLEQGRLTCGTTWHSGGLVGQVKPEMKLIQLIKYSRNLYKTLEQDGHGLGWRECGSLNLAKTDDRLIQLKRSRALAEAVGVECHILTPSEVKDKCPQINTGDLVGGLWVPGDGVVTPTDLSMAFVRLAKKKGVQFFENVKVDKIVTDHGHVSQVQTAQGHITCEYFVNCAGLWAREIGKKSKQKVAVPIHACEHHAVITKPIADLDPMLPVIRDLDGSIYFREWNGGLLAGGFEPKGKPIFHTGVPDRFEFQLLPEDWDHFQILLDQMLHRMPSMMSAQVKQLMNGPEAYTPDGNYVLGETPEVDNYYVAAGMSSTGVQAAGGVGKYMAEWIMNEVPSLNLWAHDILRFVIHHNNRKFIRERVRETIASYSLRYPQQQWKTGRRLRTSPLHTRLEVAGACFGETNAFERAMWFHAHSEGSCEVEQLKGTFGKPNWFDHVRDEYWACKERVCLIDMSSFTKIEIKSAGDEAKDFLQYLCSNDINQKTGTVVHTGMQNSQGGYENDCSIIPLDSNYFFMITPTSQQTRSLSWLRRHMPKDGSVQIRDVTSMYSGINIIGPHAQQLLGDLTETSTSKSDFKPMTCKIIDVGLASGIRAMRLTHAGEDGFILYTHSEYALHVYDVLMKAGKDYGIRNAGYFALRHLRIEKLFAYWGMDLTTHTTPLECGREFRVKFDKNFMGKEALLKQKENGISQRFAQFLLEDFDINSDIWPWGGEAIYKNGKFVGVTTTSGFGFTLDRMICLGFVKDFDEHGNSVTRKNFNGYIMDKNAKFEIGIAGKKFSAKVSIYTPSLAYTSSEPVFIPVPSTH